MKTYGANSKAWDEEAISTYLINPQKMIPKIKMIFPRLKNEQDRLNVIAYLDTLDD